MRRPAQNRTARHIDTSAWARPYPTGIFSPVFYSSGVVEPPVVPAAVPTPADLAARTPAPGAVTPAPVVPAGDPTDVTLTQQRLNKIMLDEKDQGRRSALRAIAESAGLDPDKVDLEQVGKLLKDAQEANRQRMSDVERREADAQAAAEKAAQQVAEAERATRAAQDLAFASQQRIVLTDLGVKPGDLADVSALLRNDLTGVDNPTEEQIRETAAKLKERRPGDFGGSVAPAGLPPAPGGAPAGGPPSRTPAAGKDAIKDAARQRAEAMGLRTKTT